MANTKRDPRRVVDEVEVEHSLLEELHGFCGNAAAEASHGSTREDAGQAIAFAKVMQHIRSIQGRESVRALQGRNPLDPPEAA
jgi:hypothetical protein